MPNNAGQMTQGELDAHLHGSPVAVAEAPSVPEAPAAAPEGEVLAPDQPEEEQQLLPDDEETAEETDVVDAPDSEMTPPQEPSEPAAPPAEGQDTPAAE